MGCDKVNGLDEADVYKKGDSGACCKASSEVTQVSNLHTQQYKSDQYIPLPQYLTEELVLQLRETVTRQEMRIQMLEEQVRHFPLKPPDRPSADFDPCAQVTACIPAVSRSKSSRGRMKGSGPQLIVLRYGKWGVTIMETIALNVCPGMEEEEEKEEEAAGSQTAGADLQGRVCET